MTTDTDRIAALEKKVEVLQVRLDWALLSSQWLLRLMNAIATDATLKNFNIVLDSDDDHYQQQYARLQQHVSTSIMDSLAEQELAGKSGPEE